MSAASMAAVREGRRGGQHPDNSGREAREHRELHTAHGWLCGQAGPAHATGEGARLVLGNTRVPPLRPVQQFRGRKGLSRQTDIFSRVL